MKTRKPKPAGQTAASSGIFISVVGRCLMETGHQILRYLPPLLVLLLPLFALLPDQGHEVIETVVTGRQWAYIALVLTPMALTSLLHSVQMLRRSAHLRKSSAAPIPIETGTPFFLTLLITAAGLLVLAAPLYLFKLADSECVKGLQGFNAADECRPGWSLLFLSAYCSSLLLIPFLMHARGKSVGKVGGGLVHKVWRHAPAIAQLLLVLVLGCVIVRDDTVIKDYGPVIAGALVSLLLARLPEASGPTAATKNYWQKLNACVGEAWPTVALAAITLVLFAAYPIAIGRKLGSLFVLYAGVLCWLVIVSFVWSCFLMLRNRLPIAGLCILAAVCLAVFGVIDGSFDAVTATKVSGTSLNSVTGGDSSLQSVAAISIAQDFKVWSSLTADSGEPRKVVIVLAEGGGVRAAQWTNDMLFGLNAANSGILRNTYAVVGVSGGALGSTAYIARLAALYDYQLEHGTGNGIIGEPTAVALNGAKSALTQDLMAPWLARFISIGAIQAFLPGEVAPSALLPTLWRFDFTCTNEDFPSYPRPESREICNRMPGLLNAPIRDFPKSIGKRALPRLVYTSTHVETGKRVIAASVQFTASDFPGAFDFNRVLGGDISLLDATYSSARFPGISRPGTLLDAGAQAHGHVVDGGYLDGSGALTASDIVDAIVRASDKKVIPIVLDLDSSPDDNKVDNEVPDVTPATGASINATFGMFQGIKHANGVRDLAAVAALRRQVCALGGGLLTLGVPRDAGPLALGWTLSQQASNRLDSAAYKVARPVVSPDARPAGPGSLQNAYKLARSQCIQEMEGASTDLSHPRSQP
ncbi:hypothetical protein [Paraburkholderia sp. BL21I4N1]|uniref:hypothetical protein n=1 Tax=Paraburkholderia sp. BL21I4N1 TaxID=1938801 RepID=UPI000CFADEB5|nr:hypothetical protein [Paraburkholderia sp. BL21I4N1]